MVLVQLPPRKTDSKNRPLVDCIPGNVPPRKSISFTKNVHCNDSNLGTQIVTKRSVVHLYCVLEFRHKGTFKLVKPTHKD